MVDVDLGSEMETVEVEERLKSFVSQLWTECGIFERLVYKHKNQHRRSSYFQYILKVRRDLKLLKFANLGEILDSCFIVINGNKPRQKLMALETLKRKRCGRFKYNFLERLMGVMRLLSEMVEPLLKAAMQISALFAQSFFMKFSVTILAVLGRIRVLVQQILLDGVVVYNTVSLLSQKEHAIKINQDGIEVVREYFPAKEATTAVLECVWQTDKYVLVEKTHDPDSNLQSKNDHDISLEEPKIQYDSLSVVLGGSEFESAGLDVTSTDLDFIHEDHLNSQMKISDKQVETNRDGAETSSHMSSPVVGASNGKNTKDVWKSHPEIPEKTSTSMNANSTACSRGATYSKKEVKNKVAFIAVKPPSTGNHPLFSFIEVEKNGGDKEDAALDLLAGGLRKRKLL